MNTSVSRLSPISVASPSAPHRSSSSPFSPSKHTPGSLVGSSSSGSSISSSGSSTWPREALSSSRKTRLKPSKVLPLLPLQPKPSNDFCTPTKGVTSSFGMTAFNQFGTIETDLETDECTYMSVHSTDMSPTAIKSRLHPPQLVYYRNHQTGDIFSYRRKLQSGRSNLGFKAGRGRTGAGQQQAQQEATEAPAGAGASRNDPAVSEEE